MKTGASPWGRETLALLHPGPFRRYIVGTSISDTALKLNMSEGAVRVSLHRGLGALAKRHRDET